MSLRLFLLPLSVAHAWWATPHMIVAQAAIDSGIMSPATIASANALIKEIGSYFPASPDFVQCAPWADDLKSEGEYLEANWHFIDIPVISADSPPPSAPPAPPPENVAWALSEGSSVVRAAKTTLLDKSRQLRFMVHFVGDIHQPLHAASYFSEQFPNGDAGGNAWPVAGVSYTKELHAVMDSGAGLYVDDLPRPLSPADAATLQADAASIIAEHPRDAPDIAPLIAVWPPAAWANESVALAESFVYTAPQAPTPLPAEWIAAAQALSRRQIAIAAYRLAYQVEYLLGAAHRESAEDRLAAWAREAEEQLRAAERARREPELRAHQPRLRAGRN